MKESKKANTQDLKNVQEYQKYFVTKKDMENHLNEIRKNTQFGEDPKIYPEDQEWWEQTDEDSFYMYQEPPLGVSDIEYGLCECTEFRRCGHNEYITLASFYKVDKFGNKDGMMQNSEIYECIIDDVPLKIRNKGGVNIGKNIFSTESTPCDDFKKIQEIGQKIVNEKNKNTGADKII